MEFIILLILIIVNGIFSMSEIALISSRKSRLESSAVKGNHNAKKALELYNNPNKFLSTVQIGITLVGIFTGIFSGANITDDVEPYINSVPFLAPYSHSIAIILVLIIVTYFTLVIGELVPKRIGMAKPEAISKAVAIPMNMLSTFTAPFIMILSGSTNLLIKLFGLSKHAEEHVTEEEIKSLIKQASSSGSIEEIEHNIVENVFFLGDRNVNSLMIQRLDIEWININESREEAFDVIRRTGFKYYPVCDDDLDDVKGILFVKDVLPQILEKKEVVINELMKSPLFIPETIKAYKALELMRNNKTSIAMVVDEYGGVQGLLTINDIVDEIVTSSDVDIHDESAIVKREDGSYLVEASLSLFEFSRYFNIQFDEENLEGRNTVAGLVIEHAHQIPKTGYSFEWEGLKIEVIDLDGRRIDKVLVLKK